MSRRLAIWTANRKAVARTLWATTLALALAAFSGGWDGCAYAQNRVALIVGNGNYQNVPPLPTTLNDAEDIAQSFERLGFANSRKMPTSRSFISADTGSKRAARTGCFQSMQICAPILTLPRRRSA
jgi:hypothetical protein